MEINGKLFIYLILILIVCSTTFSMYKVIRYYDLYANDPLVYGAKNYDIALCTCYTNDNRVIEFDQEQILVKKMPGNFIDNPIK